MNSKFVRVLVSAVTALSMVITAPGSLLARPKDKDGDSSTASPIKHVVVIFQENVSFDHYFATYPVAANLTNEIPFQFKERTPRVNNLLTSGLLGQNPNSTQPFRLSPSEQVTCDQDHNYGDEQAAFHGGLMDLFPEKAGVGNVSCYNAGKGKGLVMGYYDGNAVTALWNYAQHYAMSDESYSTTFGPSTPGALNLISGNTFGATLLTNRPNGSPASANGNISGGNTTGSVIGDPRPGLDDCVLTNPKLQTTNMITVTGTNVGDLLNAKNLTWGWFQGGFAPTSVVNGKAVCGAHHSGLAGDDATTTVGDYIPHHEPFEYYSQTTNQHHLPASSPSKIGQTDQANHQYDLADFWTALNDGNLPAVSYLKAGAYQDGHAAYSTPEGEQIFLVNTINRLQESNEWREMAIIIAYDDSDGWYDHQMGPIVNQSNVSDDQLLGAGNCGTPKLIPGASSIQNGRCGYGPRQPLLVISPFARKNYVDHLVTDQSSILRFIEDNWNLGRIGNGSTDAIAGTLDGMFDFDGGDHDRNSKLILDPDTGRVISGDLD
jgi:phospholipase C